MQVKAAEHVVTGHQVAIKILNRRKIRSMDMDEKGAESYRSRHSQLSHVLSAEYLTWHASQIILSIVVE